MIQLEIDLWAVLLVIGLLFGTPPLMTVTAGVVTGWTVPRASIGYGMLVGLGLGIPGSAVGFGVSILLWDELSTSGWLDWVLLLGPPVTIGLPFAAGTAFLTWRKSL